MRSTPLLLLCLLSSLMEVHSHNIPYVSFMGNILHNNSYVDLSLVGDDATGSDNNTVQCHTDLHTCCSSAQGVHRGDWFAPGSDTRLPFPSEEGDIYEDRQESVVHLYRKNSATGPSGIYRCVIPTNAVHDNSMIGDLFLGETVYVGLYTSGEGNIVVSSEINFTDTSNITTSFTLTCISTGGPATTVTWTRNSEAAEGVKVTVLDNAVTTQYTHTLTVTGKLGGLYQCNVSNNKPSWGTLTFRVQVAAAPKNLRLKQVSPTSVRVSWDPPSPPGSTVGYRVFYNLSTGDNGMTNVSTSGVSNTSITLTGLKNGNYYTISIVGLSVHLQSEMKNATIYLATPPEAVVSSTTSTTISLDITATVPGNDYSITVTWRKLHPCPDDNTMQHSSSSLMEYQITGLDEGSTYNITVTVTNMAGSDSCSTVIATTDVEAAPSAPPEDISVISRSAFSITVQWQPVPCIHRNGNITGYTIRYYKQAIDEEEQQDISIPADITTVVINELRSSTSYVIEVAALNDAGIGNYGSIISSTLSFVTVLSTTPNSVTVTWSKSDIVKYTMIRWKRKNMCPFEDTNISTLSVSPTISNITITELEEYTSYNITVTIGNSSISDSVIAMTNESAPSAPPTDIAFLTSTSSSITLLWMAVPHIHRNGNITSYMIEYEEVDGAEGTLSKIIVGGQKEVTIGSITGLRPLTHYNIRVAAVNSAGVGPFTDSLNAATSGYCRNESWSEGTAVTIGVVCSLVFLSVGVLLGAMGLYLIQRVRSKLSKPPSPSSPPVPLAVTYEEVDVSKEVTSTQKTQLNTNEAYALKENIPTSHNTAYGQVEF